MTADRHAYCIMCHNNVPVLKRLLMLLDDSRNDIYVHVDKKTKDFPIDGWESVVKRASLTFVPRMRVSWGGASMVWCELKLLQAATQTPHAYYHLLSGMDMPLKTQDEIHAFFRAHQGSEFMSFASEANETGRLLFRVQYYHVFQDLTGKDRMRPLFLLNRIFLKGQRYMKIDRIKHAPMRFYKGAQWFSITHGLAVYLLSHIEQIKKHFRMTHCADEMFLQTIAMASSYKDHIVDNDLRCTDWTRGAPYTYTMEDFSLLTASDKLFARKFDSGKDMQIVEELFAYIFKQQFKGAETTEKV